MATKRKDASRTQWRFDRRWLELTGERYRPGGRVPAPLVNSLSSLVFAPTRVPGSSKCDSLCQMLSCLPGSTRARTVTERAEIAGWYSCNHNGFCIGRAAVLKFSMMQRRSFAARPSTARAAVLAVMFRGRPSGPTPARPPWRRVISCRGRKNGIAFAYPSDLAGTRSAELKSCPDYAHNNVLQHPATRIV